MEAVRMAHEKDRLLRHAVGKPVPKRREREMASARSACFSLLCLLVLAAGPARAGDAAVKDFFGRYVGEAISTMEEGLSKRDLSVEIRDAGNDAFTVDWTTITREEDGSRKRKSYSITFRPTKRDGIFASAMRADKFGNAVPLDPMTGQPYVRARIHGKTLTIHALHITPEGGYEMQVYDRTLIPEGLDLRFSRFRDGRQLKLITGTLIRLDG